MTPAAAAEVQAQQLKYASCMRSHGVADFPDPSATGGFVMPKSIDERSAVFERAWNACKKLQPGFSGPPGVGAS